MSFFLKVLKWKYRKTPKPPSTIKLEISIIWLLFMIDFSNLARITLLKIRRGWQNASQRLMTLIHKFLRVLFPCLVLSVLFRYHRPHLSPPVFAIGYEFR